MTNLSRYFNKERFKMNKFSFIFAMIVSIVSVYANAQVDSVKLMERSEQITAAQKHSVNIGGVAQFRFGYASNGSSDANGFEIPLVRLDVSGDLGHGFGFVVSPFVDADGDLDLQNAFADYDFSSVKNLNVKFGQFRPQFMSELNGNDEDIVPATHSLVANTLGQTFTQGVEGKWSNDTFSISAALTEGVDRDNTPIDADPDYAATARFGWNVFKTSNSGLEVGAGINHEDEFTVYVADAAWNYRKFNVGVDYAHSDQSIEHALVGTVSLDCTENIQPFVRAEWASVEDENDMTVFTTGVNYYAVNRAVKWTNQVGYAVEDVTATWDTTNTGWATGTEEGEFVFTSQFQVLF